jgi:hypothetical protein
MLKDIHHHHLLRHHKEGKKAVLLDFLQVSKNVAPMRDAGDAEICDYLVALAA